MRVNCQVLCVIAALTCAIAQQPPPSDLSLEQNVAIPMRDGILLRADILRPKGGGPFPVLVYRTPYGKHFAQKEYTIFRRAVQRGYAVVIQDVRGRYASDGEFRPYENEGRVLNQMCSRLSRCPRGESRSSAYVVVDCGRCG